MTISLYYKVGRWRDIAILLASAPPRYGPVGSVPERHDITDTARKGLLKHDRWPSSWRPSRYAVIIALAESQVSRAFAGSVRIYLKCGIIQHDGSTAFFFFAPVGRGDRLLVLGESFLSVQKPPLVINNKPKWHVISRSSLAQDPLGAVNKWRWNTNMPNLEETMRQPVQGHEVVTREHHRIPTPHKHM
ncbi:hypothetical protein EV401DRAFT_1889451 [Pisolithus croceorrhizus]|nr:hypothetical protein EV401DRAFT_1889451 [Pisolithus croceorrhizus]